MTFLLTWIPTSYPYQGALVMDQLNMQSLFNAGVSLAERGPLWQSAEDLGIELGRSEASVTQPLKRLDVK